MGMITAFMYFPETRVMTQAQQEAAKENQSLLQQVKGELLEYRSMFDTKGFAGLILSFLFKASADNLLGTLLIALPMAYYSDDASVALMKMLPVILTGIVFGTIGVVPRLCSRWGERTAFFFAMIYLQVANLNLLLTPVSQFGWFGTQLLWQIIWGGYDGLLNSMVQKLLSDKTAKWVSLRTLCGYGLNIVTGPMYAWSFDAKATSYFWRCFPVLISLFLRLCETITLYNPTFGAWPYLNRTLDVLTQERERLAKEAENEKTTEEKKAD